ncbi:Glutathione S-transferase family protein [Sulfidibacter corallicola]|uniref:Glutathione S-transferase family protein n=1 Tax=Sulfidibacter corallicola TaxID=2818388 RepID=A0A8A4TUA4_SULCO|nr:glutathione S-transferase family protein [Sulfidibacter corallicola]QTD53539.1 glutathione S-transferase family protein [Sulfidibacter corallicola]
MYKLHGVGPSPFVRKVLIALAEKKQPFEWVFLIPVNVAEEYLEIHPMGKVPSLQDGDLFVPDSSAILAYLDRKHPENSLYPDDAGDYARAIWLEEYADTRMNERLNGKIYAPRVIRATFFGEAPDEEAVEQAIREELPPICTYLEKQVSGAAPIVGPRLSVADLGIATIFVSLQHAGVSVDAATYPKLAAYATWLLERPSVAERIAEDKKTFAEASQPA